MIYISTADARLQKTPCELLRRPAYRVFQTRSPGAAFHRAIAEELSLVVLGQLLTVPVSRCRSILEGQPEGQPGMRTVHGLCLN
jgi:hypothetical protein